MQKREFRIVASAQFRATKRDDGGLSIEGYAAVFDQPTVLWSDSLGEVREVVRPGTFTRAIKEKQDVRCLFNHDSSAVLGRTKSGTLELSEDKEGLHYRCDLPDTQLARDLHTSIERGDIDQCSFGFCCVEDDVTTERHKDGTVDVMRELKDVDLLDVSPVTYPAYEGTSVAARSADAGDQDLRKRVEDVRSAAIAEAQASQVAAPQNAAEAALMQMRVALALHKD